MIKTFIIILTLIGIIFNGCIRQTEIDHAEFMSVKKIHFNEHNISAILGMPVDMVVQNDLVIVLDMQNDKFFHVFSKEKFDYLGNAIRRGKGPNDEISINSYFRKYGPNKILYKCFDAVKIAEIKLSEDDLDIIVLDRYDLPPSLIDDEDFFKIEDFIFSSLGQRLNTRDYLTFCKQTGEISEWGELIPFSDKKGNSDLIPIILNQKLTTVNFKDNLIASVFHMFPILRIYSIESENLIVELQMTDALKNEQILLNEQNLNRGNELVNYYYRVKSTDDFIYALYAGYSVADLYKDVEMLGAVDFSNEIHIWKWDGTPVMKLDLERPVFSFDVTYDNKKIIASSIVDVDKLFEAEIPWN